MYKCQCHECLLCLCCFRMQYFKIAYHFFHNPIDVVGTLNLKQTNVFESRLTLTAAKFICVNYHKVILFPRWNGWVLTCFIMDSLGSRSWSWIHFRIYIIEFILLSWSLYLSHNLHNTMVKEMKNILVQLKYFLSFFIFIARDLHVRAKTLWNAFCSHVFILCFVTA